VNTNNNIQSGEVTYNNNNNTNINSNNVNTNNNNNVSTSTNTNFNNNVSTSTNTNNNNNNLSGEVTYNNNNKNDTNINSNNVNTNNNNSVSVNTNNNNNVSTSTNVNKNDSTSVNTNNNNNVNVSTSTAVNKNENVNKSESVSDSNVTTNNTNTNINRNENITKVEQEIKAPPASAIAPMISTYSQDVCVSGISGAVQTQVFGLSGGKAVRDMNCERLKLSKTLYDMGMKVAAVSLMCQDERVFKAMEMAGTPCPYMGKIGREATAQWEGNKEERPDFKKKWWKIWSNDQETSEDLPVAEAGG
jgi:hypothetical protein